MRRLGTGEVVDRHYLEFSYPPRWHYDVLRALDHFRSAGARDERLADAVELVRSRADAEGRWPLENSHPGDVLLELEDGDGAPSRWNTLRALRVLRWWGVTTSHDRADDRARAEIPPIASISKDAGTLSSTTFRRRPCQR